MSVFRVAITVLIIYPLHVLLPSYVQDLVIFFNPIYSIILLCVFIKIVFITKRAYVLLVPILCALLLLNSSSIHLLVDAGETVRPVTNLKIATFNVKNRLLYRDSVDELSDWKKRVDPDVICFQEYCNLNGQSKMDSLFFSLGYTYKDSMIVTEGSYANYGLKVFSKYPLNVLMKKKWLNDTSLSSNGFQVLEVLVNSKSVIISNCHLNCYKLIEPITFSSFFSTLKTFIRENKVKNEQGNELLLSISGHEDSPIILTGDFNSFNYSYVSERFLTNGFYDSFSEAGRGAGETLNHKLVIPLRIDYQYHNKNVDCVECHVDTSLNFSDHRPLICEYTF